MSHILYAARLSYFSGKARSYLHYKQVDFEERFADSNVYRTVILPRIGYPVMPVTITQDDQAIQDTSELIDYFEHHCDGPAVVPATPVQRFVASLLELYGDEWLVIPAMHYRWVYNRDFALGEFGRIAAPDASQAEQLAAAEKSSAMFQGVVPLLGATAQMAPAVETSYLNFLGEFDAHLGDHDFVLGGRPCHGDFGLIGPLYAHLYRDPASGEIMKRVAPRVVAWIERMIAEPFVATGEFIGDDAIPATLIPILKRMMSEQGPCLLDLFDKMVDYKKHNGDKPIARMIGMHPFTMEGQTGSRMIVAYTQWMAQRAFEPVAALGSDDRAQVDQFLKQIGGERFVEVAIGAPVERINHKLVWRA